MFFFCLFKLDEEGEQEPEDDEPDFYEQIVSTG